MLRGVSYGLARGRHAFGNLTPNPLFLVKSAVTIPAMIGIGLAKNIIRRKPMEDIIGETIGYSALPLCGMRFVSHNFKRGMHIAYYAPKKTWFNGLGGRADMIMRPEVDADINGRIIKRMIIVYHHANKAGKHIDVHIGRRSFVYRVSGKPFENDLKFNSQGYLTETSKELLLNHLRAEIAKNSRVPQNLDHSLSNARMSWPNQPELSEQSGYGYGPTRQVIAEQDVEFYHPHVHSSVHFYAPILNPNQGLYLYNLYPGDQKRAPIDILGTLEPLPEKHYHDRLHMTLVQPEDFQSKFVGKINSLTTTRKYDGASCYFSSNGQGFKFFSPRTSAVTGKQIEYTYKLCELADVGSQHKPVGMAELMFWKKTVPLPFRGVEGVTWKYLSATEIGGILNSNSIRPRGIHPELRVYRMDKWDGIDTHMLPFFENRMLQTEMLSSLPRYWKTVDLCKPVQNSTTMKYEGFVGVPEGLSVNDGFKIKWWADANDWQITHNGFSLSDKGNIQGVIEFKSLESGKSFNMGPGQIGSFDDCMALLSAGDKVIGMVAKVHGRQGHEGRAAKLVSWHLDKGSVPEWFQ